MTLPLELRLDCHKPYGARSIAEIVESNCSNRSTIQPQKQRVIGRFVFVCMILVVVTESSSLPENLPADRVIFMPIALGRHFNKLVVNGYPAAYLIDPTTSATHPDSSSDELIIHSDGRLAFARICFDL